MKSELKPFVLCFLLFLFGGSLLASDPPAKPAATPAAKNSSQTMDEDTMRFEGEKRYGANCGRCHRAPQKLSPRAMATAIRHMRVRATLTDEDMHYILWYMTR